jgi:hypothetical protein
MAQLQYSIREHRASIFAVKVKEGEDVVAIPRFRSRFEAKAWIADHRQSEREFARSASDLIRRQSQPERVTSSRSFRALRTLPGPLWRHRARGGVIRNSCPRLAGIRPVGVLPESLSISIPSTSLPAGPSGSWECCQDY